MTGPTPWLNKQFLQTALGTGIRHFEVRAAVGKGDNYTSDLYRVIVYTEQGREVALIVKRELADDGEIARLVRASTAFSREIQMYSITSLRLREILQKIISCASQQFAAQYIYSCPGTIVLQDLCNQGFKMAERRQGLDLPHCSLVMRTLARFHAASAILYDREPHSMKLFDQNFFSEPATQEGLHKFESGSLRTVAAEVQTWPKFGERYAKKLRTLADKMLQRIIETTRRDDKAFNVLAHGDLWVNNMMFRYSGQHVQDLRFVDFQFLHFTSPAIDLQYFFNTSPTEEVRMNYIPRLMQEYHSTLWDTLKALGYSHKVITLDELHKEYDKKVIYGVHGACCVLPLVLSDTGIDLDEMMMSGTENPSEVYKGEIYRKALQRMLPIFEQKGAFR